MTAHLRPRMPKMPKAIYQAVSTQAQPLVTQPARAVAAAAVADQGVDPAYAGEWLGSANKQQVRQIIRRSRCPPEVETSLDLLEVITPYISRPPSMDPFRVWVFTHELSGPPEDHFYAWTTHRMLESVHWWPHANNQVDDKVGKLFLTFDGDHDVISGKSTERQSRLR